MTFFEISMGLSDVGRYIFGMSFPFQAISKRLYNAARNKMRRPTMPENELLLILLTTVLAIGTGVIANLLSPAGFEFGPLATWVSGAASTAAVIVALRGHRKTEEQRTADKRDKNRSTAYQAFLKIEEYRRAAYIARSTLRTQTNRFEKPMGDRVETFYEVPPPRILISRGLSQLSGDEENIFVRLNEVKTLLVLKDTMKDYQAFLEVLATHAELHNQFSRKLLHSELHSTGLKGHMDPNDTESITLRRSMSAQLSIAIMMSDRILAAAVTTIPPAIKVLQNYLPGDIESVGVEELTIEAAKPSVRRPAR